MCGIAGSEKLEGDKGQELCLFWNFKTIAPLVLFCFA